MEEDLVRLDNLAAAPKVYSIPATRIAEELGKKMVLNVVMVGFFCAITKAVGPEACKKAVAEFVPKKFKDLNLAAFDKGYQFGLDLLEKGPAKEENGSSTETMEVETR